MELRRYVLGIRGFIIASNHLAKPYSETSVYRKPTHTGVFLNFKSIAPMQWKNGLIYGMLHRAYLICSSTNLFNKEVDKLRAMFINNSYSVAFFNKVVAKFRANAEVPRSNVDQIEETKGPVFKIPFVGLPSIVNSAQE